MRGVASYDLAHLLGTVVLLMSFALLYQRRLLAVLKVFAAQAFVLALAAAWHAYAQAAPHLYVTAALTLVLKAIVIPVALQRIVIAFNVHRTSKPRSASASRWSPAYRW